MKAVILAAGEGTRLRPFTLTRPKHLISVGGKTVIEYVLDAVKNAGVNEVRLNNSKIFSAMVQNSG